MEEDFVDLRNSLNGELWHGDSTNGMDKDPQHHQSNLILSL